MKHNITSDISVDNIEKAVNIISSSAINFNKSGNYTTTEPACYLNLLSEPDIFYRYTEHVVIGIKSKRTGKIAYYIREKLNKDTEIYVPTFDTIKAMPNLANTTLTIFRW